MKTSDILLIGGVGVVLLLVMQKKSIASQRVLTPAMQNGGKAQPGTVYATPTQTAGIVAGAVNGILNWISGTPDNSTAPTTTTKPKVDDMTGILGNSKSIFDVFGNSAPDATAGASDVPQLNLPSLSDYMTGAVSLE